MANKKVCTMIARYCDLDRTNKVTGTTAYSIIDEQYKVVTLPHSKVVEALKSGKIEITNLELSGKELVASNGALNNYPIINNATGGQLNPHVVIINRVESNSQLVGYTAFNTDPTKFGVCELSIQEAVMLANKKLISNGKIRHTQQGDIVSSIKGEYPLRAVTIDNATHGKKSVVLNYITHNITDNKKYAGLMIDAESAVEMKKIAQFAKEANKRLTDSITIAQTGALAFRHIGSTSIFTAVAFDDLEKILGMKDTTVSGAFSGKKGYIVISAIDYNESGEVIADSSVYTKNWGVEKTDTENGNDNTNSAVKKLTAEVTNRFSKYQLS